MFKPYEGNEKYIFVSYNHDDSEKVYDIITEFHHRGYRIWHDKGIPLGDSFLEHLAMREKECSVVFSFLSPAYFESQYCMQELKFAVTNGKPIIPIMLEEFELGIFVEFDVKIQQLGAAHPQDVPHGGLHFLKRHPAAAPQLPVDPAPVLQNSIE